MGMGQCHARATYPWERDQIPIVQETGCVCPTAVLDGCGVSCPLRYSISGLSSPYWVAILTMLFWPTHVWYCKPYNKFQLNICILRSVVNIFCYKLKYTFPVLLLIFHPYYDSITCTRFACYILWLAYLTLCSFLFHRLHPLERVEDVEAFYFERVETLRETFGVLLLLYSVISTKVYFYFLLLHSVVSVWYSYLNSVNIHEIKNSHCGEYKGGCVMGCYTMYFDTLLPSSVLDCIYSLCMYECDWSYEFLLLFCLSAMRVWSIEYNNLLCMLVMSW
jgi:hypothetical protein